MPRICYVDNNIVLNSEEVSTLELADLEVKYIDVVRDMIHPAQIELLLLHSQLCDQILSRMNRCKYIGIRAHHTDYINPDLAREKGIIYTGLKNQYGINAVAEHTMMLIFAVAKNLVASHFNTRQGEWRHGLGINSELAKKRLGIIGYGLIGRRVAELAKAFGMEVLIAAKDDTTTLGQLPLDKVLQDSDFISIHISAKPENRKFIDKTKLNKMKRDAVLINTARGGVLDYEALEEVLREQRLRGAGLDVFPHEPLTQFSLFAFPNVICTPHVAFLTQESIRDMNRELIANLLNFIGNRTQ